MLSEICAWSPSQFAISPCLGQFLFHFHNAMSLIIFLHRSVSLGLIHHFLHPMYCMHQGVGYTSSNHRAGINCRKIPVWIACWLGKDSYCISLSSRWLDSSHRNRWVSIQRYRIRRTFHVHSHSVSFSSCLFNIRQVNLIAPIFSVLLSTNCLGMMIQLSGS